MYERIVSIVAENALFKWMIIDDKSIPAWVSLPWVLNGIASIQNKRDVNGERKSDTLKSLPLSDESITSRWSEIMPELNFKLHLEGVI